MKKISLLFLFVTFISTILFADYRITRGPEVGEIYYIGPTVTQPAAIYHSTDFGETATCMDSTLSTNINFMSITADLTSGVLYGYEMTDALYISYDYGQEGSWQFRDTAHWDIHSGRNEGEIFDSLVKHSIDYGTNFIYHSMNGFFGSRLTTEIDNQNECGYILVNQYGIPDTLWLLITYDNFNNINIQNVYNRDEYTLADLSRGTEYGELYNFAGIPKTIFYSNDYGLTWEFMNEFNYGLDYTDLVGGRQEGEVYILVTYTAFMHTIDHTYIFHSTDYGRTFTVYHPFAKGEEPLVANFSSSLTEGEAPFTVQFSNYSVGEILSYEWDFDNDGIMDSYELQPEFTYQDTGYYSVKLIIHDQDDTDEFLREDFIYVTNGNGADNYELEITNYELNNYPNPFNPTTTINYSLKENSKVSLKIYNIKGQKVKTLVNEVFPAGQHSVIWNGKDDLGEPVSSGIYFYKMCLHPDSSGKAGHFQKVRKMILLR